MEIMVHTEQPKKIYAHNSVFTESLKRIGHTFEVLPWTYWWVVALPGLLVSLVGIISEEPLKAAAITAWAMLVPLVHYVTSMVLLHQIAWVTDGQDRADAYIRLQAKYSVYTWMGTAATVCTLYFVVFLAPIGFFILVFTPLTVASEANVRTTPVFIAYAMYTVAYLTGLWFLTQALY